jgi:hypothetical protein
MFSCGFTVSVHIVCMLSKSVSEGPSCLANILLATSGLGAGDGVADVVAVAVHLCIQVHLVGGGSGFKSSSWLDIGSGWTVLFSTFSHSWHVLVGTFYQNYQSLFSQEFQWVITITNY